MSIDWSKPIEHFYCNVVKVEYLCTLNHKIYPILLKFTYKDGMEKSEQYTNDGREYIGGDILIRNVRQKKSGWIAIKKGSYLTSLIKKTKEEAEKFIFGEGETVVTEIHWEE